MVAHLRRVSIALVVLSLASSLGLAAPAPADEAGDKEEVQATVLYEVGMKALDEKRYEAAAHTFDEAYRLYGDVILLWNAARAHHLGGKLEAARERYNACLAIDEFPADKRQKIADYLVQIALAQKASAETPAPPPADPESSAPAEKTPPQPLPDVEEPTEPATTPATKSARRQGWSFHLGLGLSPVSASLSGTVQDISGPGPGLQALFPQTEPKRFQAAADLDGNAGTFLLGVGYGWSDRLDVTFEYLVQNLGGPAADLTLTRPSGQEVAATLAPIDISMSLLAPGVLWVFDSIDAYAGASLGLAWAQAVQEGSKTTSQPGLGLALSLGQDWRLSESWIVGVSARAIFAKCNFREPYPWHVVAKDVPIAGQMPDASFGQTSFVLMGTATYD